MRLLIGLLLVFMVGCGGSSGPGGGATAGKVLDREEFQALVDKASKDSYTSPEKLKDRIIEAVGKPTSTESGNGTETWRYKGRTRDRITGRTDGIATIEFAGGVVRGSVRFD